MVRPESSSRDSDKSIRRDKERLGWTGIRQVATRMDALAAAARSSITPVLGSSCIQQERRPCADGQG